MAEDVEVMSVQEEGDDEVVARDIHPNTEMVARIDSMSASSDITSSNSATQSSSSTANGDIYRAGDLVSSVSDTTYKTEDPEDSGQPCDCSSSSSLRNQGQPQRPPTATVTGSLTPAQCSQSTDCDNGVQYGQLNQSGSCCPSDTESEIVVDDSPLNADNAVERVGSSNDNDNGLEINLELVSHHYDNGNSYIRPLGRSRSVTPSPSYIRLATPSTPGTPRLRSGSVSGAPFPPASPRPSNQSTPCERPRAGSMGEIEMKERAQGRVKIIDGLDILQLPRPRNPGGILPLNGHDQMDSSDEALNLIIDNKPSYSTDKIPRLDLPVSRTFGSSTFRSLDTSVNNLQSKQTNSSYMISNIIKATPNREKPATISSFRSSATQRQGCSINESVERPKPSSEVDSEGVAKKIARLNSGGFLCSSTTTDTLWSRGQTDSLPPAGHLSSVRVLSDKTPPERPKPPRRTVLSPADSIDITGDRFTVSSSVRRRLSSPSLSLRGSSPSVNGCSERFDPASDVELCPLPHQYKCRLCGFTATSLNMLQMHTTRHGGNSKTFRCSQCDYTTLEKSNFRRHRRLHHKASPINMLKCIKCSYSTSISRKLREHYQQAHPDLPASSLLPGLTRSSMSPPSYLGQQGTTDAASGYPGQFYDNSLLMHRSGADRLGYPYSITGRHPALGLPFDQYNHVPYSGFRDRQNENMASSYLRSIVTSIMNAEGSSRQPAATSTVTSSSYYMQGLDNSSGIQDVHTCNGQGVCSHTCNMPHSGIKIKVEADADNISDVSSCNMATPDISGNFSSSQNDSGNASMLLTPGHVDSAINSSGLRRHRSANADIFPNHVSDVPTDLSSPRKQRAISDTNHSSPNVHRINLVTVNVDNVSEPHDASLNNAQSSVSETIVKTDSTTRGIQCVLPVIKTEIDLDGDYYDLCHRPRFVGIERAVQCNLNNSTHTAANMRSQTLQSSRMNYRSQSASDTSDQSEQHSLCSESRCEHCGISFEDEVLYSIHIGCHSHTDPFKCNVCGKQCGNKYGFYSHIMRGHQF